MLGSLDVCLIPGAHDPSYPGNPTEPVISLPVATVRPKESIYISRGQLETVPIEEVTLDLCSHWKKVGRGQE